MLRPLHAPAPLCHAIQCKVCRHAPGSSTLQPCSEAYRADAVMHQNQALYAFFQKPYRANLVILSFSVAIAKQCQGYLMMPQMLLRLLLPAPHLQGPFVGEHLLHVLRASMKAATLQDCGWLGVQITNECEALSQVHDRSSIGDHHM